MEIKRINSRQNKTSNIDVFDRKENIFVIKHFVKLRKHLYRLLIGGNIREENHFSPFNVKYFWIFDHQKN